MDKKLRKNILQILKDYDKVTYLSGVTKLLMGKYQYTNKDDFEKRVRDYLRILGEAGYVLVRENQKSENLSQQISGETVSTYCLTEKGYAEFDPWYAKLWRFFTNDFAKILSVISLILSIAATVVSLSK